MTAVLLGMPRTDYHVPLFAEYDEDNVDTAKMLVTPEIARLWLTGNDGNRPAGRSGSWVSPAATRQ